MLVSLLILYAGFNAARDTLNPLLGQKTRSGTCGAYMKSIVMAHEDVAGMHDLVVHDYGPGRQMISLHAEVPANGDILKLHDTIDVIEQELEDSIGCEAVIHMDPIVTDDESVNKMHDFVIKLIKTIDEEISMHDFRMVKGPTHTNLIFDVAVNFGFRLSDEALTETIKKLVAENCENCYAVVKIDKNYI